MTKKLWLATVEHVTVPGMKPALFYQATEPSDRAIKRRFAADAKPAELEITSVLDLSHTLSIDPKSFLALEAAFYGFPRKVQL